MEFVGCLAVFSDAVEGLRAFVMLESFCHGACCRDLVTAWYWFLRSSMAADVSYCHLRETRAHEAISVGALPSENLMSCQRLFLEDGNSALNAVDQTNGSVFLDPAPGRRWEAFVLPPSRSRVPISTSSQLENL